MGLFYRMEDMCLEEVLFRVSCRELRVLFGIVGIWNYCKYLILINIEVKGMVNFKDS